MSQFHFLIWIWDDGDQNDFDPAQEKETRFIIFGKYRDSLSQFLMFFLSVD